MKYLGPLIELLVSARRQGPRGSQLMIRVYEDLNLGIYFGDFGNFLEFWDLFWDFFRFFCFFLEGRGLYSKFNKTVLWQRRWRSRWANYAPGCHKLLTTATQWSSTGSTKTPIASKSLGTSSDGAVWMPSCRRSKKRRSWRDSLRSRLSADKMSEFSSKFFKNFGIFSTFEWIF